MSKELVIGGEKLVIHKTKTEIFTWLAFTSREKTSLNEAVEIIKSPFGAWYKTALSIGLNASPVTELRRLLEMIGSKAESDWFWSVTVESRAITVELFCPYKQ